MGRHGPFIVGLFYPHTPLETPQGHTQNTEPHECGRSFLIHFRWQLTLTSPGVFSLLKKGRSQGGVPLGQKT